MTNKKLKQAKKSLYEILDKYTGERPPYDEMYKWLEKYHVHVPSQRSSIVRYGVAVENAYKFLQREMMFNACVSAKWSCIFAATAAVVATLGVLVGLYTSFFKMIILMLKGI